MTDTMRDARISDEDLAQIAARTLPAMPLECMCDEVVQIAAELQRWRRFYRHREIPKAAEEDVELYGIGFIMLTANEMTRLNPAALSLKMARLPEYCDCAEPLATVGPVNPGIGGSVYYQFTCNRCGRGMRSIVSDRT